MKKLLIVLVIILLGIGVAIFVKAPPVHDIQDVKINTVGGLCFYGGCWSNLTIVTDGFWSYEDGSGKKGSGSLSKEDKTEFNRLLKITDFKAILGNKFTDMCPSASDGPNRVYTFRPANIIIDDCEVQFDTDNDLARYFMTMQTKIYSSVNSKP